MARVNDPSGSETQLAEKELIDSVGEQLSSPGHLWDGWSVVPTPTFAGIELDLLVVSTPLQRAFAVEVRWRRPNTSLHLGAVRQLAAARKAWTHEGASGPTLADYLQGFLHWPVGRHVAAEPILVTNQKAIGTVADAAAKLNITVIAESVTQPHTLAQRLLEYFSRLGGQAPRRLPENS